MTNSSYLINKLNSRNARVGVVGLGYVGLPLLLEFRDAGFEVVGVDIDPQAIATLSAGESRYAHIPNERLKIRQDMMTFSTDFGVLSACEAIIICVPTPLSANLEPDLSFIRNSLESMKPHLRAGQAISLESTSYPGTTNEIVVPVIESAGFTVGESMFVGFSPEREDPGSKFALKSIPKVVSGVTPACLEVMTALYEGVVERVVPVSTPRVAEMTKLLENIYRAVNIGLVNELKILSDRMGIDVHEVIQAASTKPFGFTPFYPGPGIGGHCIPVDPFYLTWKAREFGLHTRFIELAGEINRGMPQWVMQKVTEALNERGLPVKHARVLVLGLAYKKNVADTRESPSVEIMELLRARGAVVDYADPHVPAFPHMRKHQFDLTSVPVTETTIPWYDAIIVATDHDTFDYELIQRHASLIIDTRGRYRSGEKNVVVA